MNRDALIKALEKLPKRDPDIGPEELDRVAESIMLRAIFGRVQEVPRFQPVGRKRAEQEIIKYVELCGKLREHMLSMSRTSFDAIGSANKGRDGAINPLRLMVDLDEAAKAGCMSLDILPDDLPQSVKGAPRKLTAATVRKRAAEAYQYLTGNTATFTRADGRKADGRFLAFLGEVFDALGIKASPESQAKGKKMPPAERT